MPPEIVEMTDKFMKDPVKILVKNQQLTLDGIKQFYISLQEDSQKFGTLIQLYKNMVIAQCMVFTNRKERVKELADKLTEHKFVVSCISGDMEMSERVNVMKEFRSGSSRILISTDLLGRGIDIQQVNLIINYDLPTDTAKYIHRIGRSGRFGRKGVAINFVTPGDAVFLANLRQYYNTQIEELPLDLSKIYEWKIHDPSMFNKYSILFIIFIFHLSKFIFFYWFLQANSIFNIVGKSCIFKPTWTLQK